MNNECKNYIHNYKCDIYNENHDACKNCEMRVDNPIVFIIRFNTATNSYTVVTTDERVVCIDKVTDNLLSAEVMEAMCNITGILNNRGYAVLFEVNLI